MGYLCDSRCFLIVKVRERQYFLQRNSLLRGDALAIFVFRRGV